MEVSKNIVKTDDSVKIGVIEVNVSLTTGSPAFNINGQDFTGYGKIVTTFLLNSEFPGAIRKTVFRANSKNVLNLIQCKQIENQPE